MRDWTLWACVLGSLALGFVVHRFCEARGRPLRRPGYMARRLWPALLAFCLILLFDEEGWVVAVIVVPLLGAAYVWTYGRAR